MSFVREINRLLIAVVFGFMLVAFSAAYWAMIGPDTILLREDNPRLVEAESRIDRGEIFDRQGILLAESIPDETGIMTRSYPYPETSSLLGYYSLRYGTGGAEAAYDDILRSDNQVESLNTFVEQSVLHQPQAGSDIRLTLDLGVQQEIVTEMAGYDGAAFVMSVPDGEVLALVSQPTYDANMLDEQWESLIEAPGNPFFNRVLQGQYQPGSTLQTPLMAALLLTNRSSNTIAADATVSIEVDDLTVPCAFDIRRRDLSFRDAYAYACPSPFVQFASQLGVNPINEIFTAFQLDAAVTLAGFIPEDAEAASEITPEPAAEEDLTDTVIGQGQMTISPLNLALVVSAITHEGSTPQPRVLQAIRSTDDAEWEIAQAPATSMLAFTTAETARQLRELMVYNAGIYDITTDESVAIGAHVALAYSGDETQTWFYGFAQDENNRTVVAVVVLEQTNNTQAALDVGVRALEASIEALNATN